MYDSQNAVRNLVGTIKAPKPRQRRILATAKNPRVIAPFWVAIVSLVFSFWFLPIQYINPAGVGWVFIRPVHLRDVSGHAIQAMFFGQEPWHWPPGRLVTFGGPVGASLINGAVSPVLAFPAKLLETLGLIGQFWQFVGMQGLLGICLSALALYFLARALGASEIASGTAALLCLPLPNLFVVAVFNESLSWQFLAVIPMILLLRDKQPSQPFWPWLAVMGMAIWSNTYFAAMILAFFVAHLWVIRRRYSTRIYHLLKQSLMVALVAVVLHYLGGGFLLHTGRDIGSAIGFLDILSVDLADFFHSQYIREGYVYRGLTVIALLLAWACVALVQRTRRPDAAEVPPTLARRLVDLRCTLALRRSRILTIQFLVRITGAEASGLSRAPAPLALESTSEPGKPRAKTIFIPTLLTAAALFAFALGPIIHFGTAGSLRLPLPVSVLQAMTVFRGVGRFSWPLTYLLLGIAALAIDSLVKHIPATGAMGRFILMAFCLLLVALQFVEMYPELKRFRNVAGEQAVQVLPPNPILDAAAATSREIEFVPAFDDPSWAP